MKIMIMGQSGAGKSTLARSLQKMTGSPLLALDRLWLKTDYGKEAERWLFQEQERFMADNSDWIIEGNYLSIAKERIEQADLILLLRLPRHHAIYRVIKRSIKRKLDKRTRPDVPEEFKEKFDQEYLDFLRYVWRYRKEKEPLALKKLTEQDAMAKVVILDGPHQQKAFLEKWRNKSS
ncbi:topology modulation protein [Enterococcus sp. DIV1298c]|uniref:topology modulation protein n=1 Tax=Enterococcus sp. DIV1298c TaxID=2815328 RepID=UPI001A923F24|nr:topology modulation protein [Enterococcus sp. DIV1298c]MBO0460622.1 topology modulation protein [Enterococcus sp. DIV1298c]